MLEGWLNSSFQFYFGQLQFSGSIRKIRVKEGELAMNDLPLELNENPEQLFIKGEVKAIFFSNEDNYYKVLLVTIEETNTTYSEDEIVVVGTFGQIHEGESYEFYGQLTDHPKYGLQFKSTHYAKNEPDSKAALIDYLAGKKFKGIGPKTAEKMVEHLGVNILNIIIETPKRLDEITGLSQEKKDMVINIVRQEKGMQHIILNLNSWGINNNLAYKIFHQYEADTLNVVSENPYQLAIDVNGVGFYKADEIARKMDLSFDHSKRIQAGLLYSLSQLSFQEGHTYVYAKELLTEALKLLENSRQAIIDPDLVAENLMELVDLGLVVQEKERFYLPVLYEAEWNIAKDISRLTTVENNEPQLSLNQLDKQIQLVEEDLGISYGPSQKQAIKKAMVSQVFILTGGPGTGKTTVLNGIIRVFAELRELSLDPDDYQENFPIKLAAPTGRAAKRINESTDLPAATIHRLLGLTADENYDSPAIELHGDLLIVDEMSMVDTRLAYILFSAVENKMKVVLVGDRDQIPSVGPGQVFRDLIESERVASAELTDIYRQDENSSIIPLAHAIKNNQLPNDLLAKKIDRSFIPCHTNQVSHVVEKVITSAMVKGYSSEQVQVLAPIYKGQAGIDELNKLAQELFNPNTNGERKEVKFMNTIYRIGDKVLQLVNDPEQNVFNGDLGYIQSIIPKEESSLNTEELVIDFDGNEIHYPRSDWNKITLAYCTSIHKAQGSEYEMLILPVVKSYYRMLKKDLIYTAITRATRYLILIGETSALKLSLQSTSANRRTTLTERLQEIVEIEANQKNLNQEEGSRQAQEELIELNLGKGPVALKAKLSLKQNVPLLTQQKIEANEINPMIGMEEIEFPS